MIKNESDEERRLLSRVPKLGTVGHSIILLREGEEDKYKCIRRVPENQMNQMTSKRVQAPEIHQTEFELGT